MSDSGDSDYDGRMNQSAASLRDLRATLVRTMSSESGFQRARGSGIIGAENTLVATTPHARTPGTMTPRVHRTHVSYYIFAGPRNRNEIRSLQELDPDRSKMIQISESLLATARVLGTQTESEGYLGCKRLLNEIFPLNDDGEVAENKRKMYSYYISVHQCHVRYNSTRAELYHAQQRNASPEDIDVCEEALREVRGTVISKHSVLGFFCERLNRWYDEKLRARLDV